MIIRYKWLITSRIVWLNPLSLSFVSYILPHKYSTRYKIKGHIVKDSDLMKRVALLVGDANFPKKYYSDNLRTLSVVVLVVFAGEV